MFDNLPSREGTYAYKWEKYKGKDIIPSWIADTEFSCCDAILDALKFRIDERVLGYTLPQHHQGAADAVIHWCKTRYDWDIKKDWIVWTPGVVPAFNMACKAFCEPNDNVIVQTPNYPPLLAAPALNNLQKLDIQCVIENGRYTIDFEALERAAAELKTKLFILCNPMNPVGSVLSRSELTKIAEICTKYDLVLCSDEIHCDLILDGLKHIPAGSIDLISQQSITLMAASKTFNVAGLGTSFAIIPNAKIRASFVRAGAGIVPWPNVLGLQAVETAFTQCDSWLSAQLEYLRKNRDFLVTAINDIDGLSMVSPQATFLAWVDASELLVKDTQVWCEERGVGPSPGRDFGAPEYFRLNFGCSLDMVRAYLERLAAK